MLSGVAGSSLRKEAICRQHTGKKGSKSAFRRGWQQPAQGGDLQAAHREEGGKKCFQAWLAAACARRQSAVQSGTEAACMQYKLRGT